MFQLFVVRLSLYYHEYVMGVFEMSRAAATHCFGLESVYWKQPGKSNGILPKIILTLKNRTV